MVKGQIACVKQHLIHVKPEIRTLPDVQYWYFCLSDRCKSCFFCESKHPTILVRKSHYGIDMGHDHTIPNTYVMYIHQSA